MGVNLNPFRIGVIALWIAYDIALYTFLYVVKTFLSFVPGMPPTDDLHKRPGTGKHEHVPASASDSRGPCPGMNTLANHSYLNHSGRDIPLNQMVEGLGAAYNVSAPFAYIMAVPVYLLLGSWDAKLDLKNLITHNVIEHDSSMTRKDKYFGDNYNLNPELFNNLIKHAQAAKGKMGLNDFANLQSERQADSREKNPDWTFGPVQKFVASGEPTLTLLVFGNGKADDTEYTVDVEDLKTFFGQEKLPKDFRCPVQVTFRRINALGKKLRSLWA